MPRLATLGLGMLLFLAMLEGIGFGFLVLIFFISAGVAFQLKDLRAFPASLALVPLFLVALLAVRGLPAPLYARTVGRRAAVGGLGGGWSASWRR